MEIEGYHHALKTVHYSHVFDLIFTGHYNGTILVWQGPHMKHKDDEEVFKKMSWKEKMKSIQNSMFHDDDQKKFNLVVNKQKRLRHRIKKNTERNVQWVVKGILTSTLNKYCPVIFMLDKHNKSVTSIVESKNNNFLFTGGLDCNIFVYNLNHFEEKYTIQPVMQYSTGLGKITQ